MRKTVATVCFLALSLALASLDAQSNHWQNTAPPTLALPGMLLQAPGVDIGATVRDLRRAEADGRWFWRGVMVETVTPDGPASRAGLKKGDIIIELDHTLVTDTRQFARLLLETPLGHQAPIAVIRNGVRSMLALTPVMAESSRLP